MSVTLIFPAGEPWAGIAATVEAGLAQVVQERRSGQDRQEQRTPRDHGQRGAQRRQAAPLPVSPRIVVTP